MEKKTFQENGPKKQAGTAIYKYSKTDFNQKVTKRIGERHYRFLKGEKKKPPKMTFKFLTSMP